MKSFHWVIDLATFEQPWNYRASIPHSSMSEKLQIDFWFLCDISILKNKKKVTRTNHILQNKEIGESLSGKEGLADAPAQSCLVPTLDIMFLLIHAARCKRHVALTGLISFPSVMLPRKRAYTNIHKHTQTRKSWVWSNELMSTTRPWLITWIIKHGWYLEAPYALLIHSLSCDTTDIEW